MRVRICECSFHLTDCRTRIPFRFGIHTMTEAPLCVARILVERESGDRTEGFSSDLLVPKWFEKNPDQPIEDDWRRLCSSARAAAHDVLADPAPTTVYEHWRRIYESRVETAPTSATDLLVRGEGVSLIERALIDAACRLHRCSFPEALRADVLGLHADPSLSALVDSLSEPVRSIAIRHTVGLVDALTDSDIAAEQRVGDGLPETLEADIDRYGLTHFKLKVCGDVEADLDRLRRIGGVLRAKIDAEPLLTLDGNEQFASIAALNELIRRMGEDETTAWMLDRIAYVEQPLARHCTFDDAANEGLRNFDLPCIIDEADFSSASFPDAIELGYRGVSVKNCKGVFRALKNRAVCAERGSAYFQSGEDLTNLPIIALQQDLATASVLGLRHVERNGHHYFRGLDHLPLVEQHESVTHHADLYEAHDDGVQLRIEDGSISIGSILECRGYGFDVLPRLDKRVAMENWSPVS